MYDRELIDGLDILFVSSHLFRTLASPRIRDETMCNEEQVKVSWHSTDKPYV